MDVSVFAIESGGLSDDGFHHGVRRSLELAVRGRGWGRPPVAVSFFNEGVDRTSKGLHNRASLLVFLLKKRRQRSLKIYNR